MSSDDVPVNLAVPKTDATLTVRVIKSFEYRTEKSLILHHVNLETTTVGQLKETRYKPWLSVVAIQTQPAWKPYRNVALDTIKLYTKAHGAKTTNLIINLDHDEWIFEDDSKTLAEMGLENESEVSFFNRQLYEDFKQHPDTRAADAQPPYLLFGLHNLFHLGLHNALLMEAQREDLPRISVETLDDWRRIKRNYTIAALTALDEQLSGSSSTEDREALLAHLHRFIDKTFEMARPNVRVNGQNLEEINEDEEDMEPFDEGFDRHIWSLSDQSLRWDLQIAKERRTKPEEIEKQMRELLASQAELDAEEAAAMAEVAEENVQVEEDLPADMHQRIEDIASQTFAIVEELKQAVPVQLERSERVKTVAAEINNLKL
ncbi:hypothetical protein ONZ51_g12040 [Trametes cubensis]|uniref:Uncharacterized protein n=1 Tax=Trametes cubensis TaxID=1111947 RepID=A0AAD7TJA1_9APHY|nr:hypothetical protein ONZ51_g12040 [Trametes cubensis]